MYRKIQSNIPLIAFNKGAATYTFLETGDIYEFCNGYQMVNQYQGNLSDGAISNIYLRVYENGKPELFPLRGKASQAVLTKNEEKLCFTSRVKDILCKVEFVPCSENLWFWNVTLNGTGQTCDVVYVQDTGVGDKGAILNNTLYVSQYVDHKIMENEWGYVIGSRQNMSQGGKNPYLQQGCFGKHVVGYATDAMQLYGRKSKLTHIPEALYAEMLPNEKYQYELGLVALQTEKMQLNGEESCCFYGYFTEDHPEKTEHIQNAEQLYEAWKQFVQGRTNALKEDTLKNVNKVTYCDCMGEKFSSAEKWFVEGIDKSGITGE